MKRIMLLTTEDGDIETDNSWHLSNTLMDAERVICNGQVVGAGESAIEYREQEVKTLRGITCKGCLDIVKWFKDLPK